MVLILDEKVTSNLPKFSQQKFFRPNSKSSIYQRFQAINNMGNSPRRDNIYKLNHRCVITYDNIQGKVRSNHNYNWLKTNGQNNYTCYECSKLYFSQLSEKWKDHIFPFLILFIFGIIIFFDVFFLRHCHRNIDNLEMVNQFTRQKNALCYLMMSSRTFKMRLCLR